MELKSEIIHPGFILIKPRVFADSRGFFLETHSQRKYETAGISKVFVQDNQSHSIRGAVRGMHYQLHHPQAKLIYVANGEIFDAVVDIRLGSPTFGQWGGVILSSLNKRQVFVPEGFAHGFCVTSDTADVIYKCSDLYQPGDEYGILWNDSSVGINWPLPGDPVLSEKDAQNPRLEDMPQDLLPKY